MTPKARKAGYFQPTILSAGPPPPSDPPKGILTPLRFLLASAHSFWYTMGMLPIIIRKRTIEEADLQSIQAKVDRYWAKGRNYISTVLCRQWNWRQPNGRIKDMACRELLLTLNRKGLLRLPPRLNSAFNDKRNRCIPVVEVDQSPLDAELCLGQVELKSVRNTPLEALYNSLT